MAKRRVRTIIVVILLVLTVALAGGAVYLSYWINKNNQEVKPSEAAGTAQWFVGGWPDGKPVDDTSIVDGWCQCKLGTNPCPPDAGFTSSGYDSYCISNLNMPYPADIKCNDTVGGATMPFVFNKTRQGNTCDTAITCPYTSTQVKVKKTGGNWVDDITNLTCGESFSVELLHNNNSTKEVKDMVVSVKGPDGVEIKKITASDGTVKTSAVGKYTLTGQTLKKVDGTNFYTESQCKDTATVTCTTTTTTPVCGDGTLDTGEECEVGHTTCPTAGETCNVLTCQCSGVTTQSKCENLDRISSDPVGTNEVELFTVQVSGSAGTVPYPASSVKLRVSTSTGTTPVGEDYYNPGQALVSPIFAPSYDPVAQMWIYSFAWRATGLVNGDYDVEVSFDNGTTWDTTSACVDTFTFDSGEEVEPTFLIIKTGSSICTTAVGAVIDYTLRVTNLGPGTGTIDYVEDKLDTRVQDDWVSDITSSKGVTGTVTSGTIRWDGTAEQRTFTADESATYTYTVSIPAASLSSFTTDVANVATVVFGDNQTRYNLETPMNCPGGTTLPGTGIFDNTPWILGTFAVIFGLVAFKLQVGQSILAPLLDNSKYGVLNGLGLNSIAADHKKSRLEKELTRAPKFRKKKV